MTPVDFPGLHRVRSRGRTYLYAWRGGPRIRAAEGTPEFAADWSRLVAARPDPAPAHAAGTLQAIITAYQFAPAFTGLAASTRGDYVRRIRHIETAFGDLPLAALSDPRVRGDMLAWRDRVAAAHPREADYRLSVLQTILSWAWDRRAIPAHPLERPGRTWRGSRKDCVWLDGDVALIAAAPPQLRLPALIALWTGQRQGDILRLPWSAWDGAALRLRQGKTGRRVTIPAGRELRAALDAAPRRAVTICTSGRGLPWTPDGFRASWARWCPAGLTFGDLRGTAVTRLALAGCSVPEIVAITGHSLRAAESILDRHYLSRDRGLAESAIARLDEHRTGTAAVKPPVKPSPEQ